MEIPRFPTSQRSSLDPPEIFVHGSSPSDRHRSAPRDMLSNSRFSSQTTSSKPMSIPHSRPTIAPPALPPPQFLDRELGVGNGISDPGWKWEESRREGSTWGRVPTTLPPGSSLYNSLEAGSGRSIPEDQLEYDRRSGSFSAHKSYSGMGMRLESFAKIDEGYASLSSNSMGSDLSKRSFQSAVHDKFQMNPGTLDKSLIRKLDSRRGADNATPPRLYPRSPFSSSVNDAYASPTSRIAHDYQYASQKPFSMPIPPVKIGSTVSSSSHWTDGGLSTVSSRAHHANGPYDYRSPTDRDDPERSPLPHLRHSTSGSFSHFEDAPYYALRSNGESDRNLDSDADFPDETSRLRRLRIDDTPMRLEGQSPASVAGHKRRASSPLKDDLPPQLHTVGSIGDLHRRRESASRASPTPRLHSSHGSISSTASGSRNGSYISNLSLAPSSMTSMSSRGRLSPGGLSPNALSPTALSPTALSPGGISPRSNDEANDSPSSSLTASPRPSVASPNYSHAMLESRPRITTRKSSERNTGQVKRVTTDKAHGIFMCECCPKKPKKFETEAELNLHEMEKQHECQYCKNRFKNKNEAERHQNSLHLRRHSWSCATLSDYSAAFHSPPTRSTESDICGYCGEEFLRSAVGALTENKMAIARDRDARYQHLVDVHRFNTCNHTKKFFRADHFRQHLKHSHAGTSGKWTNMLENACMKDEPLPEPRPSRITEEVEDEEGS